jgi:hypothetical protein
MLERLARENTLAHYRNPKITSVISFMIQAPEVSYKEKSFMSLVPEGIEELGIRLFVAPHTQSGIRQSAVGRIHLEPP